MNFSTQGSKDFSEKTHEFISRGVCLREGAVLLCRNKAHPERSFLPGGHVDEGEGAREALVREIKEELGLEARAGDFLGAAEHFFGNDGAKTFEINLVFRLEIADLPESGNPESAEPWQEFFWQPIEKLADAGFQPASLGRTLPQWCATHGSAPFASSYREESAQ